MMYEAFKVVGFPGGRAWAEWWGHEAVYGAIVWAVTMSFGWAYRATHSSGIVPTLVETKQAPPIFDVETNQITASLTQGACHEKASSSDRRRQG